MPGFPSDWLSADDRWTSYLQPRSQSSLRLRGSEVRPGITSITPPRVKLVTNLFGMGSCIVSVYMPHGCNAGPYCSVEERATPKGLDLDLTTRCSGCEIKMESLF